MKPLRITKKQVIELWPKRPSRGNKTHFGRVKVWAGSEKYLGAGVLTARAAFRIGAGFVIWESEKKAIRALEFIPELILQKPEPLSNDFVYAVGPGLGTQIATKTKIQNLYKKKIERVVLDADALNVVAKHNLPVRPTWIMTPHAGEMSRLLGGVSSQKIEADRMAAIQKAQEKFGCIIVLKGHHSLISTSEKVYLNPTGNSALAKAGSGDVLTGMIAGLLAQGLTAAHAAVTGTYLHGLLADLWIKEKDIHGLTPSDLLVEIPRLQRILSHR